MNDILAFGDLRITLVLDGYSALDSRRVYYPAEGPDWPEGAGVDASGSVAIRVMAALIQEGDHYTLVDTGYGETIKPERPERLLDSLAAMDVQPKQIDRVILTHAHGDHCMGNTLERGGRWLASYPLAEYVVQEDEIAAMRDSQSEVWMSQFQPLLDRGQLRIISGETELSDTLACWPTPGHTSGHQSVLIRSQGKQAMVLGDLAVTALNMERPEWGPEWAWSRAHDVASRRRIAEWAVDHDGLLIVAHDPIRPWIRLERTGSGFAATPAQV